MCGIVAYLGYKTAYPILIKGLKRLEYRGYDSSGIALNIKGLKIYKKKGKVADLEAFIGDQPTQSCIGIGHTRWATHGEPNDKNAHPHLSGNGRLCLVHNGIIENYITLKKALLELGHEFNSETDTEVLIHLIEEIQSKKKMPLSEAVRVALNKVEGAYAIVVMDKEVPNKLVAARKSSPLVVGIGELEFFVASDASPIIDETNKVIYLEDEQIITIDLLEGIEVRSIKNELVELEIHQLTLKLEEIEKGGYDYFMLKEIHDQPRTIAECMRGRVNVKESWLNLGGLIDCKERFLKAERFIIVACGTSWHAGLIAEYLIEDIARISVEVEYASEFRYRNPVITERDIVIAISQSGETADTLAALELAKSKGAFTYGIVNSVGSSIARFTDSGSYIHAGPEIGVASTKAFTGQVTLLTILALILGKAKKTISNQAYDNYLKGLIEIPSKIKKALKYEKYIEKLALNVKGANNALYLGRGVNFPVALEGALKLKEISYIHAEGYPAAEMKHGPIALIDEKMPVIVIATNKSAYDKIVSNIQEVKARKGIVIAIVPEGDKVIANLADYVIPIPRSDEIFAPLISSIPLQLLSYYIAIQRGCNVDQPRNLAKSVTVE